MGNGASSGWADEDAARVEGAACRSPEAIGHPLAENILWLLDDAYGHRVSELGYETEGHLCLTTADLVLAKSAQSSLLYGEVLPHGVVKVLDEKHLSAVTAQRLFDLGSGTGKLCMQGAQPAQERGEKSERTRPLRRLLILLGELDDHTPRAAAPHAAATSSSILFMAGRGRRRWQKALHLLCSFLSLPLPLHPARSVSDVPQPDRGVWHRARAFALLGCRGGDAAPRRL